MTLAEVAYRLRSTHSGNSMSERSVCFAVREFEMDPDFTLRQRLLELRRRTGLRLSNAEKLPPGSVRSFMVGAYQSWERELTELLEGK